MIDKETREVVDQQYERVKKLLLEHQAGVSDVHGCRVWGHELHVWDGLVRCQRTALTIPAVSLSLSPSLSLMSSPLAMRHVLFLTPRSRS